MGAHFPFIDLTYAPDLRSEIARMYFCVATLEIDMKTAKVFMQGNSQAVRLPKEFRVDTDELLIKKSGDSIVLTPKGEPQWKNLKAGIAMFRGSTERNQPKKFDRRNWSK